jgi:hypothetical protein
MPYGRMKNTRRRISASVYGIKITVLLESNHINSLLFLLYFLLLHFLCHSLCDLTSPAHTLQRGAVYRSFTFDGY